MRSVISFNITFSSLHYCNDKLRQSNLMNSGDGHSNYWGLPNRMYISFIIAGIGIYHFKESNNTHDLQKHTNYHISVNIYTLLEKKCDL